MKIVLARSAGFCMGVKRAIEMAETVADEEGRTIYTHGPLIHNPQELEVLRGKGIVPLDEEADAPHAPVIVRAHGVGPGVRDRLTLQAERLVDATCPKVSAIQERIAEFSRDGYTVVIAGDPDHPEVVGLVGHAVGATHVIRKPDDVDALPEPPEMDKAILVAQTTQDEITYENICARFLARYPKGETLATICRATHLRQSEVRKMVTEVEAMVVVGGRNSANTKRLFEISREAGVPSYLVESAAELDDDALKSLETVGVTAGASTPEWIIREVIEKLSAL